MQEIIVFIFPLHLKSSQTKFWVLQLTYNSVFSLIQSKGCLLSWGHLIAARMLNRRAWYQPLVPASQSLLGLIFSPSKSCARIPDCSQENELSSRCGNTCCAEFTAQRRGQGKGRPGSWPVWIVPPSLPCLSYTQHQLCLPCQQEATVPQRVREGKTWVF